MPQCSEPHLTHRYRASPFHHCALRRCRLFHLLRLALDPGFRRGDDVRVGAALRVTGAGLHCHRYRASPSHYCALWRCRLFHLLGLALDPGFRRGDDVRVDAALRVTGAALHCRFLRSPVSRFPFPLSPVPCPLFHVPTTRHKWSALAASCLLQHERNRRAGGDAQHRISARLAAPLLDDHAVEEAPSGEAVDRTGLEHDRNEAP
jgi:hypothetical protein